MADYAGDYISGKIQQLVEQKLSPATKKALKESKQKHNAIKAAGKTRIGNLARPGRGGAGGGGFLDNLK